MELVWIFFESLAGILSPQQAIRLSNNFAKWNFQRNALEFANRPIFIIFADALRRQKATELCISEIGWFVVMVRDFDAL